MEADPDVVESWEISADHTLYCWGVSPSFKGELGGKRERDNERERADNLIQSEPRVTGPHSLSLSSKTLTYKFEVLNDCHLLPVRLRKNQQSD